MITNKCGGELTNSSLMVSQTGTQEGVSHADLTQGRGPGLCCQTTYQDITLPCCLHGNDQELVLVPVSHLLALWPWKGYLYSGYCILSLIIIIINNNGNNNKNLECCGE